MADNVIKFQTDDERRKQERENQQRQESQQRPRNDAQELEELEQGVHKYAYRAMIAQDAQGKRQQSLKAIQEVYPQFAKNPFEYMAKDIPALLLPTAAIAVDTMIFSPTADYFARMVFPDSPGLVEASRWAVPVSFVAIETAIASFLARARDEARDGVGRVKFNAKVSFWTICGALTTFVLPSLAIANLLAEGSTDTNSFLPRLLGLSLLSMAMHSAILFSGKYLHEAFVLLFYKRKEGWLNWRISRLRKRYYKSSAKARSLLRRLIHKNDHYNASYHADRRIRFEAGVQNFLNETQNEFVLQDGAATPNRIGGAPQSEPVPDEPQPEAQAPPPDAEQPADDDDDFERRRRIAEAEEEVAL